MINVPWHCTATSYYDLIGNMCCRSTLAIKKYKLLTRYPAKPIETHILDSFMMQLTLISWLKNIFPVFESPKIQFTNILNKSK